MRASVQIISAVAVMIAIKSTGEQPQQADQEPMLNTSNLKVLPLPFLVSGLAALLFSSVALSSAPMLQWLSRSSAAVNVASAQQALPKTAAVAALAGIGPVAGTSRCEECGVVDSTRQVAATGTSPLFYQITLRMSNGSMRILNDAKPASLHPGEHIILISGLNPPTR